MAELIPKHPRIAVCISGLPRTAEHCLPLLMQCFSGLETDWFFSTWSTPENFHLVETALDRHKLHINAHEFVSEPCLHAQEREIMEQFPDTFPDFFILHQWYGFKRVLALRQEWAEQHRVKHDIIVRARFDIDPAFNFQQALAHFMTDAVHIVTASTGGYDQFFYGRPEIMDRMLSFPQWMLAYGRKFGTSYGFHASPLLKAFFLDAGVAINHMDLPLSVIRPYDASPTLIREARTRAYIATYFPDLADRLWVGERAQYQAKYPAPWDIEFGENRQLFFNHGVMLNE